LFVRPDDTTQLSINRRNHGIGIINKICAYALQDEGADKVEANEKLGFAVDAREYQQCAEILFDLGLCKVRRMSNNPDKIKALKKPDCKSLRGS